MSWRLASRVLNLSGPRPLTSLTHCPHNPKTRSLLASSLAAVSLAVSLFAGPAAAADLSGSSAYDSPYDDPRYADIYRHPPPRSEVYRDSDDDDDPHRRTDDDDYDDEDVGPRRHAGRDREYLPPMRSERRYSNRRNSDCVPRHQIRDRLQADGWRDFQDLTIDGEVAVLSARRPSGRLFELEIHRCSGEIVDARPQRSHAYGRRRVPSRS